MFVPCHYREPDGSWIVDLVRNNPLATLISNGAETKAPYATHVPVIMDPRTADQSIEELTSVTLWGHMNRANPHWRALTSDTSVAVIFTGPHGYVSPTVYQMTPAAPTWNFAAVHVHGVLRKVEHSQPGEETLETVAATVHAFEHDFGTGWSMSDSMDYFRRILPGVGAFRIDVSDVDGMFKLSQEQDTTVRRRVQQSFTERESPIGALMSRLPSS